MKFQSCIGFSNKYLKAFHFNTSPGRTPPQKNTRREDELLGNENKLDKLTFYPKQITAPVVYPVLH